MATIICIGIIVLCLHTQNQDAMSEIAFIVQADEQAENTIKLVHTDGIHYAFIPSYADWDTMSVVNQPGYCVYLDGKPLVSCADLTTNQEYELSISNQFGVTLCKEKLVFVQSGKVPTLFIDLIDGTVSDIHSNKDTKKTGTVTIIDASAEVDYQGPLGSMSGRGNTTWGQDKKPYNLEFDTETMLLGMGATKKYCLLANACDESSLRNKVAYDIAKEIGVSCWVDSEFVDLYVDGAYYGLYLLTEGVSVNDNVVNISDLSQATNDVNQYPSSKADSFETTQNGIYQKGFKINNNPADITGGYLLEIEIKERLLEENSGFMTQGENCFYIKAPQYASYEQVNYISNMFQLAENSLASSNIGEYLDLESWVRFYLAQEIVANSDINSFYLCKDVDSTNSKIFAGPVWDCDFSLGSGFVGLDLNPHAFYVNTWGWFQTLYRNPVFLDLVKEIYTNEMKGVIEELIETKLDQYCQYIQEAYLMNEQRWKESQPYPWCNHYDTLQEHQDYLRNFLIQRTAFLDSAWIDGVEYYRMYYKSAGPVNEKHYYSIEYGEVFGELPELSCDGYQFMGYFDNTTGEPYDPSKPITENQFFVAKWEPIAQTGNSTAVSWAINVLRDVYYNIELYCSLGLFGMMVLAICIGVAVDYKKRRRISDG